MALKFGFSKKPNINIVSQFQVSQHKEQISRKVELLNRKITLATDLGMIEAINQACVDDRKITVASYNVHSFNLSMQMPWFYKFQQNADIILCDGFGILMALNYFGFNVPIQYRISATALVPKLVKYCSLNNLSIFLLGTKPEVLTKAIQSLKNQYPNLKVFGHHGYFNLEDLNENQHIVEQINLVKPNILIVGMGMPRQEQWLLQYRPYLQANVFIPCGAVIDRLAGIVPACPQWASDTGLEWLHRLIHEPKRLAARYLLGNSAFVLQVILAKSLGLSAFSQEQINHKSKTQLESQLSDCEPSTFPLSSPSS